MRLAVIADIHGSLPSLEAVLREIHALSVDGLLVAGDMTCGPNSAEVLQRLQEEGAWMVLGNNEDYLLRFDSGQASDWWHTSRQWALNRWTYRTIDKASLELLHSLPEQRVINLPGTAPIRMFHGSLRRSNELLDPNLHPEPLQDAFAHTTEPVLICGHTHIPWQERRKERLAFNPGAVLFPCNGDLGAQYAILTWNLAGWEVEHYSVAYDHSLVRKAFTNSGLLQEGGALALGFLLSIETGRDVAMDFLNYAYRMAAEAGHPGCENVPDDIWDAATESFDWEREIA
jgi:putative phosphoesterase